MFPYIWNGMSEVRGLFCLQFVVKGALCSLEKESETQNCNIYNITEVKKIQTQKYLCITFYN